MQSLFACSGKRDEKLTQLVIALSEFCRFAAVLWVHGYEHGQPIHGN